MAQALRIEASEKVSLVTAKTKHSLLWFVNNIEFTAAVLGYLAKYAAKYHVVLYAFNLQGNHYHLVANFPTCKRAAFAQAFNAAIQRMVKYYVEAFEGGALFDRRYSEEWLPLPEDVETKFFYCALQPVNAGLCSKISEYPGYNSFHDASTGAARKCWVFDGTAYYRAKRRKPNVSRKDFYVEYELKFKRLPGYEHLSQAEYKTVLQKKLERNRQAVIAKREGEGKVSFLGRNALLSVKPGSRPTNPKVSTRHSFRPLVISVCPVTRDQCLTQILDIRRDYRVASERFRKGEKDVVFPPGTYKPAACYSG